MNMDTVQVRPDQGERKSDPFEGKLRDVTAFIDDLTLKWYLDKNRLVVLLPRMGSEDKTRPWWPVYNRDGPDDLRLMGDIHARGRPPEHTQLVFHLGGFLDPDLFWRTVDEIIEELRRAGFPIGEGEQVDSGEAGEKAALPPSFPKDTGRARKVWTRAMWTQLRQLRDELEQVAVSPGNWSGVETWAQKVRPLIKHCFREWYDNFQTLVTEPRWMSVPPIEPNHNHDDGGFFEGTIRAFA